MYLIPKRFAIEESLEYRVAVARVAEVDEPVVVFVERILSPNVSLQLRAGPTHHTTPPENIRVGTKRSTDFSLVGLCHVV